MHIQMLDLTQFFLGAYADNTNARAPQYRFFNDIKRTDEQTAYFGEITYPVSDKLDITVGARKYDSRY